jgi:hypothetical protein
MYSPVVVDKQTRYLVFIFAIILFFGCNNSRKIKPYLDQEQTGNKSIHKPRFLIKNNFNEISFSNPNSGYERLHGQYEVYVTIHNIRATNLKRYEIMGDFYDNEGKFVGTTDASAKANVNRGDSTRLKLTLLFPFNKSLPWNIVIRTSKYE